MKLLVRRCLPLLMILLFLLPLAGCNRGEDSSSLPSGFEEDAPIGVVNGLPGITPIDNKAAGAATAIEPLTKDVTVGVGVQSQLAVKFTPETPADQGLAWVTSNAQVATVNETGLVTGVAAGSCTITASYNSNPQLTAQFAVTVGFSTASLTSKTDFLVVVYIGSQTVTVYTKGPDGKYTTLQKTMVCSTGTGTGTITGDYTITAKYRWRKLVGSSYGQYGSSLGKNNYLFHSLPYSVQAPNSMSMSEYNKLGQKASQGCVRLCVADAKWIYDTVPLDSAVLITDAAGPPGPAVTPLKTDSQYVGWDPTDPAPNNPYLNPNAPVTPVTVSLNKTTLNLQVGKSETLTASASSAASPLFSWSSNDTSVATVQNGKVTAKKAGTATITAKYNGAEASCTVVVEGPISITLNYKSITTKVNSSYQLKATVRNAVSPTVTWTTSNAAVATVDTTGKVTGKGAGTATITASYGGKSATCAIKITETITLTIDKTTLTLTVGETGTIKAQTNSTQTISFTSSNAAVAKVDSSGKVTALKAGTATITVTCNGINLTCVVTVKDKPASSSSGQSSDSADEAAST